MSPTGEVQDAQQAASSPDTSPSSHQANQHPSLQLRLLTLAGLRRLGDVQEVPETTEASAGPLPPSRLGCGSEPASALSDHHGGARRLPGPVGWAGPGRAEPGRRL